MRDARIEAAVYVILTALVVLAIWSVPFLPTNDGPNHLANCVMASRLADPASSLHRWLVPGDPVTTQGFQVLCRPVEALFGWRAANAAVLSFAALLWAAGIAFSARAVSPRNPLQFLGFATAFSWCFYMGFINFVLAAGLSFVVLGVALRVERPRLLHALLFAAALLVVVFAHPFVAMLLGAAVATVVLVRASRADLVRVAGGLVVSGLPAALMTLLVRAPDTHPVEWHSFAQRIADVGDLYVGGPAWRSAPPALITCGALVLGLVAAVRGRLPRRQLGLLLVAWAALVAFFFSPFHADAWAYFSPRFLTFGLPLAVAVLPESSRLVTAVWPRRLALAVVVLVAMTSLGWSITYHRWLEPHVKAALAGLDAPIRRTGPRLPLFLSRAGDGGGLVENEPLDSILHLYLFEQGGVNPYLFATVPSTDPILYREPLEALFGPIPDRFVKNYLACAGTAPNCPPLPEQYEFYAQVGGRFEDVILFSDDLSAWETFERRGYAVDYRAGPLAILRPRRCHVDLHLAAEPGLELRAPARLVVGWTGLRRPVIDQELDLARVREGTVLALDGFDCGALWARVVVEGARCAGEEGDRGLAFRAAPDAPGSVTCTLVASAPHAE